VAQVGDALLSNTLLLVGVIVSAFGTTAIMFFYASISSERLQGVVLCVMGDMGKADLLLLALVIIYLVSRDRLHRGLRPILDVKWPDAGRGEGPRAWRRGGTHETFAIYLGSLIPCAAVSLSAMLGFVGPIMLHARRLLVGYETDDAAAGRSVPGFRIGGGTRADLWG
jgi:iron complex transport system permease protein